MALVAYSDSEGSDTELQPAPKAKVTSAKPSAFQKVEPRKIKVDLPSIHPDASTGDVEDRPLKRARTGGAFSGFNSLLPAPKRAPAQSGLSRGVSLKTSSEAAFSRRPLEGDNDVTGDGDEAVRGDADSASTNAQMSQASATVEPKIVGKATKFKPLSVQGVKKKKPLPPVTEKESAATRIASTSSATPDKPAIQVEAAPPHAAKPKRSLFSVPQPEQEQNIEETATRDYNPITTASTSGGDESAPTLSSSTTNNQHTDPNTVEDLASSLNLTATQRRQLFGRNGKGGNINIAHFNMDAEYASNEQLRQAGEVVEHRAVKSIAPGKHSLQQLVNNARSQQDNLEEKWAEGRRDRGESGNKYGWGR